MSKQRPIKVASEPNPNREVYDYLVLDMSGSMSTIAKSTMDGVNNSIKDMQETADKLKLKAFCSLLLFDHNFVSVYKFVPVQEVVPLTNAVYKPHGWTALNDAVAMAIDDLKDKLKGREDSDDVDVTITIFTDGGENKSVKYPGEGNKKLLGLIEEIKQNWHWTFAFIGAGTEEQVQAQAATVGVAASNVMNFMPTCDGMLDATRGLSAARMSKMASYSMGIKANTGYFIPTAATTDTAAWGSDPVNDSATTADTIDP